MTVANGNTIVNIPPAANRVCVMIHTASAGVQVAPVGATPDSNGCYFCSSATSPLHFHIQDFGTMVTGGFVLSGFGGDVDVVVTQTYLVPE